MLTGSLGIIVYFFCLYCRFIIQLSGTWLELVFNFYFIFLSVCVVFFYSVNVVNCTDFQILTNFAFKVVMYYSFYVLLDSICYYFDLRIFKTIDLWDLWEKLVCNFPPLVLVLSLFSCHKTNWDVFSIRVCKIDVISLLILKKLLVKGVALRFLLGRVFKYGFIFFNRYRTI